MNDAAPIEEKPSEAPSRASGSSFYTAMRILPRVQRDAMFEIYSFCRLVDDVADSNAAPEREEGAARAMARRILRPSMPGGRRLRFGHSRRQRRISRFAERIFMPSSTAWRWMQPPTFARRTGRRSTSIAIGWRAPSGGYRSVCSG